MIACSAAASANSKRRAPRAWATTAETPPPIPAVDIVSMSVTRGTTSVMPATASYPSQLM